MTTTVGTKAGETNVGMKRTHNEDSFKVAPDEGLYLVADGMGGHLYGEVASHITVQFLVEAFRREAASVIPDTAAFLEHAMTRAHHAIVDYALGRRLAETPKTTCVACVVQQGQARWAHAGDSRLYHLREGRVRAVLTDVGFETSGLYAVYPQTRFGTVNRVAFMDFVSEALGTA